jgi:hypothetical protein
VGVVAEKGVPVSSVSEVTSTVRVSAVEASVFASLSVRWTWRLSPDWYVGVSIPSESVSSSVPVICA